ncbi:Ankyrin repeat and sterile alpha motif domain-containing protein 1B [Takifugu flavidus]|uniref:Ankyrin repeat and sterile alpha motif domain-containing protein 1B n=1 Tax=Takifugu flavidus TaxID=433684 RepID=A0A5C6NCW3_9TELE|nr:Ankyrin repeat and sterile alpha motif domain-containing protein 1B [Takifugu flavidus]
MDQIRRTLDDSKYSSEVVTSPSLDVFLPEDEDNPYESVTTAVTRKPCSLDINRRLDACPGNGRTSPGGRKSRRHKDRPHRCGLTPPNPA